MSGAPALTDDELAVLDWFFQIMWDAESLAALRPLARDEAQLIRLREAVIGLFRKRLVDIRQTGGLSSPEALPLPSSEAETVLGEERSWSRVGEPLFDPHADYYLVVPLLVAPEEEDEAIPAYAAALRERGLEPGSLQGLN